MSATARSSTRSGAQWAAVAASVALWLVGSTFNPVTAISEGSSLAWRAEPATASVDQVITSVVGDPTGPKVKVVIFNGSGEQERIAGIPIVLSVVGSPSDPSCPGAGAPLLKGAGPEPTNANGVATFSPIIGCEGFDYRLKASADDTASRQSGHIAEAISSPFDVRQGAVTGCSGPCTGTAGGAGTDVQVTADSTGYIVLDLGGGTLTCESYTTTSRLATFDVTSATGRTTVVITLEADHVTRSHKQYEVCLEKEKPGPTVIQLPDCPRKVTLDTDSCVVSRTREKNRDVTVTISVKPGDPRVGL